MILSRFSRPSKALSAIFTTPSGITIFEEALRKEFAPITFTVSGIRVFLHAKTIVSEAVSTTALQLFLLS